MEQQRRRSTRHPTGSSSSNNWSVRSVMYSSGSSDSVRSTNGDSSLSSVAVSATTTTPGSFHHRLRWVLGLVALLAVLSGAEAVCDPDRWWNLEREECDPCTVCGEQQLVLRPCQEYMDTVCGTIGDLDMDLAQLARTEARHEQRHWKEVSYIEVIGKFSSFFCFLTYIPDNRQCISQLNVLRIDTV